MRQLYGARAGGKASAPGRCRLYLRRHVSRLFAGRSSALPDGRGRRADGAAAPSSARARLLAAAERPVLMVGSQATLEPAGSASWRRRSTTRAAGLPVGHGARLLGKGHRLQMRHKRRRPCKAGRPGHAGRGAV